MEVIKNPTPSLPEDIIFLILSNVASETLRRCRVANKEWNCLTYMQEYTKTSGTISGFLVQAFERDESWRPSHPVFVCQGSPLQVQSVSLEFLPEKVRIEAVSNLGLVFCSSSEYDGRIPRHYVCKPTTKEVVKIPNPKTKFMTYRTAMVVLQRKPLHCKIVRLSKPCNHHSKRHFLVLSEIFDSASGDWKRSNDIKLPVLDFMNDGLPILANGAIHWLTNSGMILAFDVRSEQWELIALPEVVGDRQDSCYKKLAKYEGRLAILNESVDKVEIWVLENYVQNSWKLKEEVNSGSAIDLYASDVVLLLGQFSLTLYNFRHGSSTSVSINKHFFVHEVFPFHSDSVPAWL